MQRGGRDLNRSPAHSGWGSRTRVRAQARCAKRNAGDSNAHTGRLAGTKKGVHDFRKSRGGGSERPLAARIRGTETHGTSDRAGEWCWNSLGTPMRYLYRIRLKTAEKSCTKTRTAKRRMITILVNQLFVMLRCAVDLKCEPAMKTLMGPR